MNHILNPSENPVGINIFDSVLVFTVMRFHCSYNFIAAHFLWAHVLKATCQCNSLTFNDSIVDSLFSCEDNIKLFVCVLKALRLRLNPPVSVQHVQYAILGVPDIESRNLSKYHCMHVLVQICHLDLSQNSGFSLNKGSSVVHNVRVAIIILCNDSSLHVTNLLLYFWCCDTV